MTDSLQCYIYKSSRKAETYLFILKENDFSEVPARLLNALGQVEKVMDIELTPERKLARGNASQIINDLRQTGFHLQLPPNKKPEAIGPLLDDNILK
ncbi:MAG: YcgL domain-containing protein [Thiohalomonadales bacterium]|nr:YcgL domain-containing protein [Thiohalomonadales bacterium]